MTELGVMTERQFKLNLAVLERELDRMESYLPLMSEEQCLRLEETCRSLYLSAQLEGRRKNYDKTKWK